MSQSLLRPQFPQIPSCAWQRTLGLGWEQPYRVRRPDNLDDGPWHGMPLGGFGAGCIGRSPRGDFNLWHLDGGEHEFRPLPACQFSLFEQPEAGPAQAYALCSQAPDNGTLSRWSWYPSEQGTYAALYPRSWFRYEGVFETELICEQFSPIWAESYQETSYPLAIFEWTVHNPTDRPVTLSIMMTWQNVVGWFTNALQQPRVQVRADGSPEYEYQSRWGDSTGNFNQWIQDNYRVGCLCDRVRPYEEVQEGEGQLAIASISNPTLEVFHYGRWNPNGDGGEIWETFAADGSLCDREDETPAAPGEQIATAFAIRFTVRPGRTRQIPFVLAWDFPVTEFAKGVTYFRRYTDFFGRTGKNAWPMVRTALKHHEMWKERILEWQEPILKQNWGDWLKMALFNELYLLADGGSLWTAATEDDPVGQFGVLECLDYRWYESLDVRLYGGFGLALLWPRLDQSVLEAFARAIPKSDATERVIGYNNATAVRKLAGATPHDLGAPNEHPWQETNYTSYQDCNLWKDLPADFVLQVYRNFVLSGERDTDFLWECWEPMQQTLAFLKAFDRDGDGIPENGGAPDQTFDDWRLQGISAYCGALWIAALEAAIKIAQVLQKNPPINPQIQALEANAGLAAAIATYREWLAAARPLYQETLWNGKYYRLDSESGSEVVMADQLCGQFLAGLLGLPLVVEPDCARSALEQVYESCFLKFHDGTLGAANGLMPDGSPEDPEATHPLEIWTGINYGLAAFMIQVGLEKEGLRLAETVVRQVYENGLQFRTPEAITAVGTFRAGHYLRAMAIWAIYQVLTSRVAS